MPSTVRELFAAAGLTPTAVVPWGTRPTNRRPGVYAVALTADVDDRAGLVDCPLEMSRVRELLDVRPELRVDGQRPTVNELATRLMLMWLPNEPVIYIGCAGSSIHDRVCKYYRTKVGARSPHAGGWPTKMLRGLDSCYVHTAGCDDPDGAERQMIDAFLRQVRLESAAQLVDPTLPLPFANLEIPRGRRKRHGIRYACAPRIRRSADDRRAMQAQPRSRVSVSGRQELPVTGNDIRQGQIRITAEPKQQLGLPTERAEVTVWLLGHELTCAWDPRIGADRERSGIIRVGRQQARDLLGVPLFLAVSRSADGSIVLEPAVRPE